ncbi:MAG: 4-hydroxy-tetrahydrodipicolinate synthase [Clostridia bacterium]|nr:4-hydroxy-tetrahydrodipicolinate synthase [Clostridia bacterium]
MKLPKRKLPFTGVATALATPFTENGIDFSSLGTMIDYQIGAGIDALVLCGTTGEAATMEEDEFEAVVAYGVEKIARRVPCIVGCGSPNTARASRYAACAARHGADAILLVTPYYNKGTRGGIRAHFQTVAEAGGLPTIIYHVPGRTGVRLRIDDLTEIATHPLMCGVKEASGDMEYFAELTLCIGDEVGLYTGNDALLLPSLSLGGQGVISVVSNLLPRETCEICRAFSGGNVEKAAKAQLRLIPLIHLLFAETNPAPLKCALALRGLCNGHLRLPMAPVEETLQRALADELERLT